MPKEIEDKAKELESSGWEFEIEIFPDSQMVNMDCCDYERQLANRMVMNGPSIPDTVANLVNDAYRRWTEEGKPKSNIVRKALES